MGVLEAQRKKSGSPGVSVRALRQEGPLSPTPRSPQPLPSPACHRTWRVHPAPRIRDGSVTVSALVSEPLHVIRLDGDVCFPSQKILKRRVCPGEGVGLVDVCCVLTSPGSRFWRRNPCLFLKLPSSCSIHTRAHTHTHTCTHTHTRVRTHSHMYTHSHVYAHTHTCTHTCTHTHVGPHAGTHRQEHTHLCTHVPMVHTRAGTYYSCGAHESPAESETKTVLRAGRLFSRCVSQGEK